MKIKKEEERGNCSSEYLCIPFSIKDMAVTCFLRNDSSSVAKSSCAPQWCHSKSSCDVTNLFQVILTMLYQIRPWEIFPSRAHCQFMICCKFPNAQLDKEKFLLFMSRSLSFSCLTVVSNSNIVKS